MNLNELVDIWYDLKDEAKEKYVKNIASSLKDLPTEAKQDLYFEISDPVFLVGKMVNEFTTGTEQEKINFIKKLANIECEDFFGDEGMRI